MAQHKFPIPNKLTMTDVFREETGWELFILDGELYISGDCTKEEAKKALDAHNPPEPTPPTVAEKLASVGLNLDDLKSALGL